MGECCSSIKRSVFVRKIVIPLSILINIGLTAYLSFSNAENYKQYKNRASYVVYHIPNTTSNYYIIRTNDTNPLNCSLNALFTFDVTTVYKNIISREGANNTLFVSVYWASSIIAALFSLLGILSEIRNLCITRESDYESFDEETSGICLVKGISAIGSQFLQKGAFIFPTYYIGIFDYTQLCLSHHSKESSFILHHTYIGIAISLCALLCLVIWPCVCWDLQRDNYDSDPACGKCIDTLVCDNENANPAVACLLCLLCLLVIPIGAYGIFVWVTSLMEFVLKTKAILISFNVALGAIIDIIKLCKHY